MTWELWIFTRGGCPYKFIRSALIGYFKTEESALSRSKQLAGKWLKEIQAGKRQDHLFEFRFDGKSILNITETK